MANADISLLFGVARGGGASEDSEAQIRKDLEEIIAHINQKPLKVKVQFSTNVSEQRAWAAQIKAGLAQLNERSQFAVKISKINIDASALNDFKQKLNAVINTLSLASGTSITLNADGIGEITSKLKQESQAARDATKETAQFKVQIAALRQQRDALNKQYKTAKSSAASPEELERLKALGAEYEAFAVRVQTVAEEKKVLSAEERAAIEAECEAIRSKINQILEERQAAADAAAQVIQGEREKEQAAREAAAAAEQAERERYNENLQYLKNIKQIDGALGEVQNKLTQWTAAKYGAGSGAYKEIKNVESGLRDLKTQLDDGSISAEEFKQKYSELMATFSGAKEKIISLGLNHKSLADRLGGLAGKFSAWLSVSQVIMFAARSIRKMISASIELDDALTQMQIVTHSSEREMQKFADTAAESAQRIGSSISDFISSATTYARLGYSMNESSVLAEYTAMLQNVGNIQVGDAQNAITAIIKAFRIGADDIESVMDKLVKVGNGFPISVAQIAEGMNNASSSLAAAGNSFEQSVALLTAANTTIQDAAKSSTGLRTIAARLRNTKTELDELGETMSEAKYGELVEGLTNAGVKLTDMNGEFRSTYDILADIAKVWNTIGSMEQAGLATALAGNRQQAVFYSIIEQFREASGAMDAMADSAGTLRESYDIFMQSITAHVNQFKAAFQELSNNAVTRDFVNGLIDIGKFLIEVLNGVMKIVNAVGGLKTILLSIAGILVGNHLQAIGGFLHKIIMLIPNLVAGIKLIIEQFVGGGGLISAITTLIGPGGAIGIAIAGLSVIIALIARHHKSFSELKAEYEEEEKAVSDLNDQYEKNQERIEELIELKENNNFSQENEEELQTLRDQNVALEGQIAYREKILELKAKPVTTAAEREWSRPVRYETNYSYDPKTGHFTSGKTKQQELESAISELERLQKLRQDAYERYYKDPKKDRTELDNLDKDIEKLALSTDEILDVYDELRDDLPQATRDIVDPLVSKWSELAREIGEDGPVIVQALDNVITSAKGALSDRVLGSFDADRGLLTQMLEIKNQAEDGSITIGEYNAKLLEFRSIIDYLSAHSSFIDPEVVQLLMRLSGLNTSPGALANSVLAKLRIGSGGTNLYGDLVSWMDDQNYGQLTKFQAFLEQVDIAGINTFDDLIEAFDKWCDVVEDGAEQSTNRIGDIYKELGVSTKAVFGPGGKVDLFNRPIVEITEANIDKVRGWGMDDAEIGGRMTVASQTFRDADVALVVTPILPDGSTLTQKELEKYVDDIITKTNAAGDSDYAKNDEKGILLGVFGDEKTWEGNLALSDEFCNKLHEIHEAMIDAADPQEAEMYRRMLAALIPKKDGFESLDNLRDALKTLDDAFADLSDAGSIGLTYQSLSAIAEKFSDVSGIDTYIDRLAQAGNNAEEVQEILRELAYQKIANKNNSEALANASDDVIAALLREAGVAKADKNAILELRLAMVTSANTTLDYSGQCAAILEIAAAAGVATQSLQNMFAAASGETVLRSAAELDAELSEYGGITANADVHKQQSLIKQAEGLQRQANAAGMSVEQFTIKTAYEQVRKKLASSFQFTGGVGTGGGGGADEYIADIDKYREALRRLEAVQKEREQIEHDLERTDDPKTKIFLERQLIEAYKDEQSALHELNKARRVTIDEGVEKLRDLGFVIEWNRENNELWIENLDHLNELDQGIIKDTEELVDSLTELNDANKEGSSNWWELKDSIADARSEINSLLEDIVQRASDAVDAVQDLYSTLHQAADEYAETGYVAVDTLQSIIALGPQYMQYLIDENGSLIINEQRIRKVIKAKTDQLAVEAAMTYVQSVALAASENNLDELNRLIYATEQYTDTTWGLVYASIEALNLSREQKDAMLHNVDAIRSMADASADGFGRQTKAMQDGLNEILQYTMDMLKSQSDQTVQSLNDQKEAYSEIIAAQKESMQLKKKEEDYAKSQQKKLQEIAKLQAQIDILSLDSSRDAQAKRAKLLEELSNLNEELAESQQEHAIEAQEGALDKMEQAYAAEKDKEIKAEEEKYSSTQKLHDAAIQYIESNWSTLYDELIDWNTEYGNSLNSDILQSWNACIAAVKLYGSYVDALNAGSGNSEAMNIIGQMKENSAAWHSADAEGRQTLANTNKELAASLSAYGLQAHMGSTANGERSGVWYLADGTELYDYEPASAVGRMSTYDHSATAMDEALAYIAQAKLNHMSDAEIKAAVKQAWPTLTAAELNNMIARYYPGADMPKFHAGGIVGTPTGRQNEMMALLRKGEMVLTEQQQQTMSGLLSLVELIRTCVSHAIRPAMPSLALSDYDALHSIGGRSGETVVNFGDVIINGADKDAIAQHRAVNREFVNEVVRVLNLRK